MHTILNLIDVVVALRWVLVLVGFIVLGVLYADALVALNRERAWSRQLEDENAEARRDYLDRVNARVANRRTPEHRRSQIVVLPGHEEVRDG